MFLNGDFSLFRLKLIFFYPFSFSIREFLSYPEVQKKTGLNGQVKDASVVVQGFGNVGYYVSKFFENNG